MEYATFKSIGNIMEYNGIRNILFLENVQNFIQKYLIMTLKKPYPFEP